MIFLNWFLEWNEILFDLIHADSSKLNIWINARFILAVAAIDVESSAVKSGIVVIQAYKSAGVVCDEGNGAEVAAIACGG